jgi:hypothetical protein
MEPRLRSEVLATALRRQAEALGGFATVLARGDPDSGAIIVVMTERGRLVSILERVLDSNGCYRWSPGFGQALQNEEQTALFLARRRKIDPDSWLIELDVPSVERFTAEMDASI